MRSRPLYVGAEPASLHDRQSDGESYGQRGAPEYGNTKPKITFHAPCVAVKCDGSNMNERRAERRFPGP